MDFGWKKTPPFRALENLGTFVPFPYKTHHRVLIRLYMSDRSFASLKFAGIVVGSHEKEEEEIDQSGFVLIWI